MACEHRWRPSRTCEVCGEAGDEMTEIPRCMFRGCEKMVFNVWRDYNEHIRWHVEKEIGRRRAD